MKSYVIRLNNVLDNVYDRLGGVYDRMGTIDSHVLAVYDRMATLINGMSDVSASIGNTNDKLDLLYNRLGGVYDRMGTLIDSVGSVNDNVARVIIHQSELYDRLKAVYDRVGTLINSVTDVNANLDSVDDHVLAVYDRIGTLIEAVNGSRPQDPSSALDAFLGDFGLPASSALSAQVQTALQSAFPFCIPAILKQVLGLLDAEPTAAQVDLSIMGASVSLDFDAQGVSQVATVTSWLCRIFFVVLLLSCSPRFIVSHPGRGS